MNAKKAKPIIFFDFDSTIVKIESLDHALSLSLAQHPQRNHLEQQIAKITNAAMNGEIDLQQSLEQRLKLSKLTRSHIRSTAAFLTRQFTTGMVQLVHGLIQQGHEVHIISGGFERLIAPCLAVLGIEKQRCHANRFIWQQHYVVGVNTDNPLTTSHGKSTVINTITAVQPDRRPTVLIGDGSNDLTVYQDQACDIFIGFGANCIRPIVEDQAPYYAQSTAQLSKLLPNLI